MNKVERAQVRLELDHLTDKCRRDAEAQSKAIFSENASAGHLQSGETIKAVLRMAEDAIEQFIKDSITAVAAVAQDMDAFGMIVTETTILLKDLRRNVDDALEVVTGNYRSERETPIVREAETSFLTLNKRALGLLEVHRFSFTKPSPSWRNDKLRPLATTRSARQEPPKNKGGKPLAAHWDGMWAAIAVDLYLGDLKPKTQADIEAAMHEWLSAHDIGASESTVRGRARQLWQAIQERE